MQGRTVEEAHKMLKTHSDFGISQQAWDAAKAQILAVLIPAAKAKRETLIFYSDFVSKVTAIRLAPRHPALAHLLGEISKEESLAGQGMLTALVVHKDDGWPGEGFYVLAKDELGLDTKDKDRFWPEQVKLVRAYWAGK